MADFTDEDLSGSRFWRVNLTASRWHGVWLEDVKITDAWISKVDISCHLDRLTVNEVDVTAFVNEELDRRHPERLMLRAGDADGLRAAWAMIEDHAAASLDRARELPEEALDESVDGEFSFIQTLRHLVFATDRWITGPVLDESGAFDPLGYPNDDPEHGRALGLDIDARPSLAEVLEVRRDRMARVDSLLRAASDQELARTVASPNGGTTTVRSCVGVVLREEWAHNRYALRDLDLLAARYPRS